MSNCPEINNTTIKGTSTILYNSTSLPCINIQPYDGVNTILTKLDSILCSAISNVEILTEEVTNITEELMITGEEIININTHIGICCSTTTTTTTLPLTTTTTSSTSTSTTTTTLAPTTTTTSSSTSTSTTTSTSTSTSTSTTTTTTTIAIPCLQYIINYTSTVDHYLEFTNCGGFADNITVNSESGPAIICVREITLDSNSSLTSADGNCTGNTPTGNCWTYVLSNQAASPDCPGKVILRKWSCSTHTYTENVINLTPNYTFCNWSGQPPTLICGTGKLTITNTNCTL